MKKWMAMLIIGTSMMLFASGCNNGETPTPQETPQVTPVESPQVAPKETPKETPVDQKIETIAKVEDANYLQDLNLASSYTLALANEEIEIELYVAAEVDDSGEVALDDGQEWALVARKGDEIYPLVERTYIQNGQLNYTVYTDYDQNEKPHIIAQVQSGAGMSYYDCSYDEALKTFSRQTIFEANNINLLYKWK